MKVLRVVLIVILGLFFALPLAFRLVLTILALVRDFSRGAQNSATLLGEVVGNLLMLALIGWLIKYLHKRGASPQKAS